MPLLERLLRFFQAYPLELAAHLSSIVPIVIGGIRLPTLQTSAKLIWLFFLFLFLKDTFALGHMLAVPNILYIQNLEVIVETFVIGFVFYTVLERNTQKRLLAGFTGLCLTGMILTYKSDEVSAISQLLFRVFCIVISLAYFNKLLTDMQVKHITRHTLFWFASGLFIFAMGTFFIFLFSEYIYDPQKTSQAVYDKFFSFHELIVILFALMSGYGLWVSHYEGENSL